MGRNDIIKNNGMVDWDKVGGMHDDIKSLGSQMADYAVSIKNWLPLVHNLGQSNEDWTDAINAGINYILSKIPSGNYYGQNTTPYGITYLYFPSGLYQVYDTINLFSFVNIKGASKFSTQIKLMADDRPLFYAGYNTNDPHYAYPNMWNLGGKYSKNINIENLKLVGINDIHQPHNLDRVKNHAIQFDGVMHAEIKDVEIEYFYGNGLEMNKIEWIMFDNVVVRYCRIGCNIDATESTQPDKTTIDNCTNTFFNCKFWYNHQGLCLNKTSNNIFYRCIFEENIGSYYNMTTNGKFNGDKLQPDEFYLQSIGINLKETFEDVFDCCYFEQQYIDILVNTGYSVYFKKCFFNPTDGTNITTNGIVAEDCARHDIMFRKNLIMISIEKNENDWYIDTDGYPLPNHKNETNQAHIVFYGSRDSSGNIINGCGSPFVMEECWFANSKTINSAKTNQYKTIRFTFDDYDYPSFKNCLGLSFNDKNSIFSSADGFNPKPIVNGYEVDNGLYSTDLTTEFSSAPTNPNIVGLLKAKHAWTQNENQNSFLFGYACWGYGNQKKVYLPENIQIGQKNSIPINGTWNVGDFIYNSNPSEAGTSGSKYIILGWICKTSGNPGVWQECHVLTGN